MKHIQSTSRRAFLKRTATTAGLTLSVALLPGRHAFANTDNVHNDAPFSPSVFVALHTDGTLEVTCHRSEMGQQVRTSIAQIIAEEMDADWQRVVVKQGTGDPQYGDQNTDGSRSIRRNIDRLQLAGATAAALLRTAAAKGWNVSADSCECEQHTVVHKPSGRRIDFKALVSVAATLPMPDESDITLKDKARYKLVGKPVSSIDLPDVVSGNTVFGQDVQLDNMLVAVIVRPPVLFTEATKVDDTAAKAIKGVKKIISMPVPTAPPLFKPLGGVAVLAENTWAAMQGAKALAITWSQNTHNQYQFEDEKQALILAAKQGGEIVRKKGDAISVIDGAENVIEATYFTPLLAQAPMEPPAATAWVDSDTVQIWACTQTPQSTRSNVAAALGVEEDKVTVNVTLLGGGFGRKSKPDFSVEAALLSQQAGQPVKVIWRREDDIQHGYYHSVNAQHIRAVQDTAGKTIAWHHGTAFPSISTTFAKDITAPSAGELDLGFTDNPYSIPNMLLEKGRAVNHVRIGWLRSVCNIFHAFAIHSFADELAYYAKTDSKDYLLSLIGPARVIDLTAEDAKYGNYGDPIDKYPIDTGRLINVIEKVCDIAGWESRKREKRFLGLAAHRSFLTYVATVVEVEVKEDGSWSIPNVFTAIDAGTIVNPEHVKAQCEGGAIYGLSCALGKISAKDGAIEQSNFHNYQVARMMHAPKKMTVEIIDSSAPAAGVGEPSTPPFAPALTNALFAATGVRIRELPVPSQVKRNA
ncbi:xanthine dehydrogenase family protein molybdopterin-binding subunit [Aestuariibacter sp. A3R04]|uniref:xanthine dehydrogenase family protein molybdopterin-binding subunit n=1 Tax=Aestuariibacter sp. A3R04 TaxID=2841571 RepID=UPI001C094806|nr:molybdopterin cofactor-binding domain-containing protein [Aestuariibacter sp. A3R04]MBU3023206.1 molybdopterin-dependent oxidoreductase [Aestuariibacter sp. A3R04]